MPPQNSTRNLCTNLFLKVNSSKCPVRGVLRGLSSQRRCVVARSSWACGHPAGRTEGTASLWRFRWRCRCATLFLRCRRRSGPLRSLSRSPYVWARCRRAGATPAWCRHRSDLCCATAPSSPASGSWGSGRCAWTRRWSFQRASSRCWQCLPPSSGGHGCSPPSPARRSRCRIAGCCEAGRTLSGPPGPHAGRLTAAARGGWSSGRGSRQLIGKKNRDRWVSCTVSMLSAFSSALFAMKIKRGRWSLPAALQIQLQTENRDDQTLG